MYNNRNNIILLSEYETLCDYVAGRYLDYVRKNPEGTIGFFTGSTPIGVYKRLVRAHYTGNIGIEGEQIAGIANFSGITCFGLDERYPIDPHDKRSFDFFMHHHFLNHVRVRAWHIPSGKQRSLEQIVEDCLHFEEEIKKAGRIGLQGLGMGPNSHVGYDEPGSAADSRTRLVDLHEATLEYASSEYQHGEKMQTQGITQGIGTIMEADEILLMGSNAAKIGEAMKNTLTQQPNINNPASLLKPHPKLTFAMTMAVAEPWLRYEAERRRMGLPTGLQFHA